MRGGTFVEEMKNGRKNIALEATVKGSPVLPILLCKKTPAAVAPKLPNLGRKLATLKVCRFRLHSKGNSAKLS